MSTQTKDLLPIRIADARAAIEDQSQTAFVVRGALSAGELDDYIRGVQGQFAHAPVGKEKPATDSGEDFVLPWIYDHTKKQFSVHRLYRFCTNDSGSSYGAFHERVMNTRDEIEQPWDNTPAYREHGYRNIHIITRYLDDADGYPRHNDVPYPHPCPMLQCWLQLTEPGQDFKGGELVLHPPSGPSVSVYQDLGVRGGDLIFFDKRTDHEVTECRTVGSGRGRMIALIGAMAPLETRSG